MINKTLKCLLGLSLVSSLTSCATIMHGTHQSVGISSNPSNAYIWVDRQYVGVTPMIVGMSRSDNHVVRIELEGYQPYEAVFSKRLSGWVFGNIIFGGVIGVAIDAVSGGLYKLTPEQIQANLYANQMMYSKDSHGSYIFVVLQPNPSWEKIGNLVAVQ